MWSYIAETCIREMASQLQKISSLILQNEQLLAALREVTNDPGFDAKKHPAVMHLLSKVCTLPLNTPVGSVTHYRLCSIRWRAVKKPSRFPVEVEAEIEVPMTRTRQSQSQALGYPEPRTDKKRR